MATRNGFQLRCLTARIARFSFGHLYVNKTRCTCHILEITDLHLFCEVDLHRDSSNALQQNSRYFQQSYILP